MASNANTGNHSVQVHGPSVQPSGSLATPSPQGPDCDPPSYHEVTMETRAPIQSDSDTLRDGIENESFDRTTNNVENDTSVSEQNPTDDGEHISERGSEDERDLNSQASDSTS